LSAGGNTSSKKKIGAKPKEKSADKPKRKLSSPKQKASAKTSKKNSVSRASKAEIVVGIPKDEITTSKLREEPESDKPKDEITGPTSKEESSINISIGGIVLTFEEKMLTAGLATAIVVLVLGYVALPLSLRSPNSTMGIMGFISLIYGYVCCYPLFSILGIFSFFRFPKNRNIRILSLVVIVISFIGLMCWCLMWQGYSSRGG
jgi:hypothetical protein